MLACVSDCDQICSNPTNNSKSKQLFSFPKGKRFSHYKIPYNKEICYELPSEFIKKDIPVHGKSTQFGIGDRPDIFPQKEQNKKPSPDTYSLPT